MLTETIPFGKNWSPTHINNGEKRNLKIGFNKSISTIMTKNGNSFRQVNFIYRNSFHVNNSMYVKKYFKKCHV